MKSKYIIIISIILLGCETKNKGNSTQEDKIVDSSKSIVNVKQETKTSNQNIQQKEEKNNSKKRFPLWLSELHPSEIQDNYQTFSQELTNYKEINDSLCYCLYDISSGVCLKSFIKTYLNKYPVDSLQITEECDHDLSRPNYEWHEYKLYQDSHQIKITYYSESAPDSMINEEGHMKEGFDFLEINTTIDSNTVLYQINSLGKINKKNNEHQHKL